MISFSTYRNKYLKRNHWLTVFSIMSLFFFAFYFPLEIQAAKKKNRSRVTINLPQTLILKEFIKIISEKTIVGNLVGTYAELVELMALADRGLVTLATKEYKLSEANQALHDLHSGIVKGRAVLIP